MNNRFQYGLMAAMILTLVACGGGGGGGGGGGNNASSVSSSVTSSSVASSIVSSVVSSVPSSVPASSSSADISSSVMSSATTSSASSSSSSAGISTTYTVSISAPQLGEGVASRSWLEKLRSFFVSEALADSDDVPLENLAVVIVDLAGNVIETIPLNDSNATQNLDGSWSINVPGYPQLDCIVIANLDGPITLVSTDNIFDLYPNALFTPTTDEELDVNLASTAAYQNLLNELGGEGTFESLGLDVNDQSQLAVLENLIATVQQVIESQVFLGANDIAAALTQIQQQVVEIVQVEATNVTSAVPSTLKDAMETGGGIHWYEAFEPQEIIRGAIVGAEAEVEYFFNGTEFEVLSDEYSSGDLLLGANGWVVSSDSYGVIETNEDGSVTLADMEVELDQINVKADQAFDLSGRNIAEFFSAYTDTRAITAILNPTSNFPAGSIGYRARMTSISTRHSLWYEPGNSEGICPWDKDGNQLNDDLASEFGGNCETVNGWIFTEGQQAPQGSNALTTIASLKSADVAWNAAGSRLIGIGWFGGQSSEVVTVQLVDNAEKTANYYLFNWNTNQGTLIGQSTWADITLPGLTGDEAAAITLNIPGTVEDQGVFNSDELKKLFAVHNGYVRTGHRYQAGDLSELGVLLINGTASDSVIAATNYKAPVVGSWLEDSGDFPAVLTFINNLHYTVTSVAEADCVNGLETGYYQITDGTLSADPEVNVDDDCGLSSLIPGNTISVEGDSLSITEGEDVFTFTRLANTDMRGTWIGIEPNGDHQLILSLLPNNRFIFSQHGTTDIENGNDGYEYGTFTYNLVNGSFNPVVEINRDGEWGFSHSEAFYTIVTDGDDMSITVEEGEEEIVVNLKRVTGPVN